MGTKAAALRMANALVAEKQAEADKQLARAKNKQSICDELSGKLEQAMERETELQAEQQATIPAGWRVSAVAAAPREAVPGSKS